MRSVIRPPGADYLVGWREATVTKKWPVPAADGTVLIRVRFDTAMDPSLWCDLTKDPYLSCAWS